jgi:hypothetical protein
MRIDCDTCSVRGVGCGDCVITVLLGAPPEDRFDVEVRRAITVLADAGLVEPLQVEADSSGFVRESA